MFPAIWDAGAVLGYAEVLAHQGGWDEALMVAVPVGLFVGLLWVASRRHARPDDDDGEPTVSPIPPSAPPAPPAPPDERPGTT